MRQSNYERVTMLRLASALIVSVSISSFAAPLQPAEKAQPVVQLFVGFSGGVSAVTAKHPLYSGLFSAAGFSLTAGVQLKKIWLLGAEAGSVSNYVKKSDGARGGFESAYGAGCTNCEAKSALDSGLVSYPSVGPRVDFSPFGETSPYLSAAGGFVFTQGPLGYDSGGYVTGRLGFRWRFVTNVEASLEGGYQAEWFQSSTLRNAFGNVLLRAYF